VWVMIGSWIQEPPPTCHFIETLFDTFEAILARQVFMCVDLMLQAINRGSVLVDTMVKGYIKMIWFKDILYITRYSYSWDYFVNLGLIWVPKMAITQWNKL